MLIYQLFVCWFSGLFVNLIQISNEEMCLIMNIDAQRRAYEMHQTMRVVSMDYVITKA